MKEQDARIVIDHITKDYGEGRGVFDISFSLKRGEILGFLGPNGAGKTTTIRQLMGFIRPDSGRVAICGKDCFTQADQTEAYLGYLPGEISFMESMTGDAFIRFYAGMRGMKDLGRAPELMERFDLDAGGKIQKMSKGMKQKIGIVCAFMHDPEILILDEPTSGLDPLMQNRFVELLLEEKERGKTILMSSHIFEEVERTCDRAAIIRSGRIVAVETMEQLRTRKKKKVEISFETETMAEEFTNIMTQAARNGVRVEAVVGNDMDSFLKAAAQFTVQDINVHTQSLEEIFMHFYGTDAVNGGKEHAK